MVNKISKFRHLAVVLALFSLVLQPMVSLAAGPQFNTDPLDKPVLRVSNYTQNPGSSINWSQSITNVHAGDVISFVFYYHNTGDQTAANARAAVSFSYGSSVSASGVISADNASAVYGSSSVSPAAGETITSLTFNSSEWYPNQSTSPQGASGGPTTFNLGNLTPGWGSQGYLVARYTVNGSALPPTGTPLSCTPTSQSIGLNLGAKFEAFGGNGTYSWSITDSAHCSGNTEAGPGGGARYWPQCSAAGFKTVTVISGAQSAQCSLNVTAPPANPTLTITPSSATVNVGQGTQFRTMYDPDGAAGSQSAYDVTNSSAWTSSNNSVANVSGGWTTGAARGSATITATYSGLSANANITVNAVINPPANPTLTITPSSATVNVGQGTQFRTMYDPDGAAGSQSAYDVTNSSAWTSSNNSVANVSGGWTTGAARGSATITATYSGLSANANITVNGQTGNPPTISTFAATNINQNSATLNGQVNPNGFNSTYWFEYGTTQSFGQNTLTQSTGSGTQTLSALSSLGSLNPNTTYYFRLSAQNQFGASQGQTLSFTTNSSGTPTLILSQNSLTVNAGSGFQIQATYDSDGPGPSAPAQVTSVASWSSSNSSIATVSGGFINGVQSGSATVTATYSGLSASASVAVYGGAQGSAPVAQTTGATNVGQNSATLNGSVNPNNSQTTYWFEYGTSYSLGSTAGNQSIGSGSGSQSVSYYLSGLNYNTVYYYRVVAQNQYGTIQGQILNFTTNTGGGGGGSGQYPIATTNYVGNQNQNTATLNGTVNPNGSQTNYWFEYGQTSALGQTTGFQYLGSFAGPQSVSAQLYNLIPNMNYYYRVAAQNSYGTAYGSIYSFTTQNGGGGGSNCNSGYNYNYNYNGSGYNYNYNTNYNSTNQPCAQTNTPTNLGDTYATFNAYVTPNGSDTTAWFEYGINNYSFNYTTNNTFIQAYNSNYNFSSGVTGLTPASTYYVRVAARNQYGITYGQAFQFSTTGSNNLSQASVMTKQATYVSTNTALLNGSVNPNGGVGNGWFEYGPTASMGLKTNSQAVGSGSNFVDTSWALTGLTPATTYYYRAVGQTSAGTANGSVLSFRTLGYVPPVNPPNPPVPPTPPQPPVVINNNGSCLSLNPTLSQSQVNSGDSIVYSLVYKNNCGYDLQNTQLKIVLPLEVSFTASNAAFSSRDQNAVSYNLGAVTDGYQGTIEIKNDIGSDVKSGATLLYGATASWNNKAGKFFTTSAYISALVAGAVAGLASIFSVFGGWGWLWLLLLLLIALAVYWIFFREDKTLTAKQKIEASIS